MILSSFMSPLPFFQIRLRYHGPLFRTLHPISLPCQARARACSAPVNAKRRAALYLAQDFVTLRHEIAQGGNLQPSVIVEIEGLIDACNPAQGNNHAMLGDPAWRRKLQRGEAVSTQDLAQILLAAGHCGMVAPSFTRGAPAGARNIVLWSWGDTGRLPACHRR
ncbi:MAG: hypothetical protein ABNH26_13380 [Celeribacter sp.]